MPSDSRSSIFAECKLIGKGADCERRYRVAGFVLAGTARRRYSLHVRVVRVLGLIAYAVLIASCAPSQPPPAIPVAANVMISRVISDDIPARPPDCSIEILTAMPARPYREVGDIQVSNTDPGQHDTRAIIDQHACAMGADAVVMTTESAGRSGSLIDATAIAYTSSLADRAAQARAANAGAENGSAPQMEGPAPAELPMAGAEESPSDEDSEQSPGETSPAAQNAPAAVAAQTPAANAPAAVAAQTPAANAPAATPPVATSGASSAISSAASPAALSGGFSATPAASADATRAEARGSILPAVAEASPIALSTPAAVTAAPPSSAQTTASAPTTPPPSPTESLSPTPTRETPPSASSSPPAGAGTP
jgi:hypothetical protein